MPIRKCIISSTQIVVEAGVVGFLSSKQGFDEKTMRTHRESGHCIVILLRELYTTSEQHGFG
jgi:hypothetical protein